MAGGADELEIKLTGAGQLPGPARQRLLDELHRYGTEVLQEASRLEAGWRSDDQEEAEITSRDIRDAALLARRAPRQVRSRWGRAMDSVAFCAAFVGGVFGNNITTPVGAVGFAVCAFVGVVAYSNRGES